jgi:predicted nucleic acid-binding protein
MVSLTGLRVYLDTNTIIYAMEGVSEFENLQSGLLDALDRGKVTAVTSELTMLEVVTGPRRTGNRQLESAYRGFLLPSPVMAIMPVSRAVIEQAIDLRGQHRLSSPDSVHIATGLLHRCDAFLTRDKGWGRVGLSLIDPKDVA